MDDRHVIRLIKAAEKIATATERIADALERQVQLDADTRHMMDVVMQADVKQTEQATEKGKHCRNCDALLDLGQQHCPYCEFDNASSWVTTDPTYVKPPEWMTR